MSDAEKKEVQAEPILLNGEELDAVAGGAWTYSYSPAKHHNDDGTETEGYLVSGQIESGVGAGTRASTIFVAKSAFADWKARKESQGAYVFEGDLAPQA